MVPLRTGAYFIARRAATPAPDPSRRDPCAVTSAQRPVRASLRVVLAHRVRVFPILIAMPLLRFHTVGALAALLAAAAPVVLTAQAPAIRPPSVDSAPRPAAAAADVGSVDAILAALYDVISGPAGTARDWNRFRSLMAPNARLMPARALPNGGGSVTMWSADDYVATAGAGLERSGFFEREIHRTTEAYGQIMHVFSTYESRRTADLTERPFSRGINSIQLLKDGSRWWVVSIFWDAERPGNEIPSKYLPR